MSSSSSSSSSKSLKEVINAIIHRVKISLEELADRNGSTANAIKKHCNSDAVEVPFIAAALKADRLLLLTDVDGVKDANGNVVTQLTAAQVKKLTKQNIIAGGMIPKTETALAAIDGGVRAVVIIDGRVQNAVLLELFTDHGAGSLIRKKN